MVKKNNLALLTFVAVFLSIVIVGGLLMPVLLEQVKSSYIEIQADVNQRQAQAMARFIRSRLERGASREEIIADFQASIEGSDADRGYVCLINQEDSAFLCHPMETMVGLNISVKNAVYDTSFQLVDPVPWELAIKNPESSSGLLLIDNFAMEEIVHSEVIPELGWVVNSHENTARIDGEIRSYQRLLLVGSLVFAFLLAFPVSFSVRRVSRSYERQIEAKNIALAEEQKKSDDLLLAILPPSIAQRMKQGEKNIVSPYARVAILFCDIVGFTPLADRSSPEKIASLLNVLFSEFDRLCGVHGVEKIKTIGDAYMAVCGLPEETDDPAGRVAALAVDMRSYVATMSGGIEVRIGIHLGEAAAGVIGTRKFSYDLWGDAVNVASRLESSGVPGKIHISSEVKNALGDTGWLYEDRGEIQLKGKGSQRTWLLEPAARS